MSGRLIGVAVALGLIVLIVALFVPSLMGAVDNDITQSVTAETDVVPVSDQVEVSADTNDMDADVTLYDRSEGASTTETIQEGETASMPLSGDTIDVTLDTVAENSASMTVVYPATFGWSDGAVMFAENLNLMVGIMAFLLVMTLLMAVRL